jgi:hypothetical protein
MAIVLLGKKRDLTAAMRDTLLVSEAIRFPYRAFSWQRLFLRPKIHVVTWPERRKLRSFRTPEAYFPRELSSLKRSYHYYGARGITSNGRHIFIASQNTIAVYDKNFSFLKTLHNPLFNGLHEICWHEGRIFVTCAVTDAILSLDEEGTIKDQFFLGSDGLFVRAFNLSPRHLDRTADYRNLHTCRRLFHINNVQVREDGIYACLRKQGAFVKVHPDEKIIIAENDLKGSHNAQFTPDNKFILINDTHNRCLRVYERDGRPLRKINIRELPIPIDFKQEVKFGENGHPVWEGWLRGMAFSEHDPDLVYLGLSPTTIIGVNFSASELKGCLKIRKSFLVSVHGLHNLSMHYFP